MLHNFEEMGYKKLITTPHIMIDRYENSKDNILKSMLYLKKEMKKENISLILDVGAEYYLDDGFLEHIDRGDILSIVNRYLLFETSYLSKPIFFNDIIKQIQSYGLIPLFAHPERYIYLSTLEDYRALKQQGILFQVDINSFSGYYGKDAKRKAKLLSRYGMIDFLGSDAHNIYHLEILRRVKRDRIFRNIFKNNKILNRDLM